VRIVRLHLLEVDHADVRDAYALTAEENLAAIDSFADLDRELPDVKFDVFEDMRLMLLGKDDSTTCVWNACDPYTTRAVRGVEGNGQKTNCGRTNKDGIDFAKAPVEGFERYIALYHTPQSDGGCKGCRFFLMCKGQCPGTALRNDWRNRSEHCEVWMTAYARIERELIEDGSEPLSVSPLRESLESHFLKNWAAGRNTIMADALRSPIESNTPPIAAARIPESAHPFPDRLDFTLPSFTRASWVSDSTREVWGPRIDRIRAAIQEMAWRSVAFNIRECAIVIAPLEHMQRPDGAPWYSAGLTALPLSTVAANGTIRVAVGRQSALDDLSHARETANIQRIGQLIGHPDCCREFHRDLTERQRLLDPTWALAMATEGKPDGRLIQVSGQSLSNPLWRWLGLNPAFQLPCRFDCQKTVEIAERLAVAAKAAGFAEEFNWMAEILSWPVEWTALHGIAEIRTPILKISTSTDATAGTYTVRRSGDRYPVEGARGVRFPYRQEEQSALLTLSANYVKGIEHATRQRQEERR
jgi:radical SAM protein with 4Fe4S-binding SPASM domain